MKDREIIGTVQGQRAVDGAGVRLVRVLGHRDVEDFDPFLMLDSFDSTDPKDYIAGFPTHPHRGIETITYLISGSIAHQDSLGNQDVIRAGESQWMTAGSGILHQEMPQPSGRMLGFQLWLNLPREQKMVPPAYLAITREDIPVVELDGAKVGVISGRFGEVAGTTPHHVPATLYDVQLDPGRTLRLPTALGETVFVFLILGGAQIGGRNLAEKTAVRFGPGEGITVTATPGEAARFLFCSAPPLREPIAWGGPIVMNTREELSHAFRELEEGTFIKHRS